MAWIADYKAGILKLVNGDEDGNVIDLKVARGDKVFLSNIRVDILDLAGNSQIHRPKYTSE